MKLRVMCLLISYTVFSCSPPPPELKETQSWLAKHGYDYTLDELHNRDSLFIMGNPIFSKMSKLLPIVKETIKSDRFKKYSNTSFSEDELNQAQKYFKAKKLDYTIHEIKVLESSFRFTQLIGLQGLERGLRSLAYELLKIKKTNKKNKMVKAKSILEEYQTWVCKIKFDKISIESLNKDNMIRFQTGLKDIPTVIKKIEGEIKVIHNIEALRHLKQLKHLSLIHTQITNIDALKHLKRLESLTLSSVDKIDISSLVELQSLEKLDLSTNEIENIQPLGQLKQLQELNLYAISLSWHRDHDLERLSQLKRLRV